MWRSISTNCLSHESKSAVSIREWSINVYTPSAFLVVEWATKLSNVLDRHQRARRRGKRKLSTTSKPKTGATPANKTGPGTGAGEGGSRFSILTEGKPDNGSKQDVVTSSQVGPSHDSRKERKEGISTSKNGVAPAHGRLRIKPTDPKQ